MAERRQSEMQGGLYERLLHRLAFALEEADAAALLHEGAPTDLKLRGLSSAEMALIQAYLEHDLSWLRGWHAAAEEVEFIERAGGGKGRVRSGLRALPPKAFSCGRPLRCALCGALIRWPRGRSVPPCEACGSRLFRCGPVKH
ncbi:hypothetical protein [Pseudomonas sp. LRF_L74]|uniref:hypothetical protein n=1 Tax=Pseudomonas sp. LRF_L74 TaxID=3369422 RepID=UPI003F5FD086